MKKILLALLVISVFISCSSDKKKTAHDNLYYFNDLETVKGWMENNTLRKGDAHSGKFYSTTDSSWQYSLAFSLSVGNISDKPLKKADVSLWALVKKEKFDGSIVTCVTRKDSVLFWNSSNLNNFYKKPNEWFKATETMNFPAGMQNSDIVKVYLWNVDGKSVINIDDMEVQFSN
jgi:hypothetical protein